jgi:HD superfamily phosphodiesterase
MRAEIFGGKFGAAKAAALAGWLHDLGKYSQAHQAPSSACEREFVS